VGATEGRRLMTSSLNAVNFFNGFEKMLPDKIAFQRKFYALKYIQLPELLLSSNSESNSLRKRLFHISLELIFAAPFLTVAKF
jgi:hypothetical protein